VFGRANKLTARHTARRHQEVEDGDDEVQLRYKTYA